MKPTKTAPMRMKILTEMGPAVMMAPAMMMMMAPTMMMRMVVNLLVMMVIVRCNALYPSRTLICVHLIGFC